MTEYHRIINVSSYIYIFIVIFDPHSLDRTEHEEATDTIAGHDHARSGGNMEQAPFCFRLLFVMFVGSSQTLASKRQIGSTVWSGPHGHFVDCQNEGTLISPANMVGNTLKLMD